MDLSSQDEELCVVCLINQVSPKRDDGMCDSCGQVSDKYNFTEDEMYLGKDE